MAESNLTTAFDQSHKLFDMAQKHHENAKCSKNLMVVKRSKNLVLSPK